MIDFRYHLVSLASVLIALAVGIVLGAGPLKEGISESLNQQVVQLRTEKSNLRTELDAAQNSLRIQEDFAESELARMVAGRLGERNVTIVSLPGSPDSIISDIEDTIGASGATLLGPASITQAWNDPSEQSSTLREQLSAELAASVGLDAADATLDDILAAVLATKTTPEGQDQIVVGEAERQAVWKRLDDAGLVAGSLPERRGSLVVLVGPTVTVGNEATTSATATPYAGQAALAEALDAAADGSVISAQIDPAADPEVSVIGAARSESGVRQGVSTVDNAGSTIGLVSTVSALVEQLTGRSGQYGLAAGARTPFPAG